MYDKTHYNKKKKKKKKTVRIRNAGKDEEKMDHLDIAGKDVKCYTHSGKQFSSFLK